MKDKLVKIGFDFNNEKILRGVWDNCQKLLKKLHQGDTKVLLSELFDFDSIHIKPPTRNSLNCECLICKIGKLKLNEKHPVKDKQKETNDVCSSISRDLYTQQTEKICRKCLTIIGQG